MAEARHIDYFDGWRGVSVLLVIVGHFHLTPLIAGHGLTLGNLGVECFFILSGRLMAEILFVRETPIDVFYWRRVSRIFPALWVFVGVLLLLGESTKIVDFGGVDAISALTFTLNYCRNSTLIGGHIWSLCVEEHAYILLSIVAVLSRRFKVNVQWILLSLGGACMINGAVQVAIFQLEPVHTYWHSDVRMASIFLSAGVYLWLRRSPISIPPSIPVFAIIVGSAIFSVVSVPDGVKCTAGTLLIAFGFMTLNAQWVNSTLSNPILRFIGLWSYSLYLWQQPFWVLGPGHTVAALCCMAFASLVSFYCVEKPARRFLNSRYPTSTDDGREPGNLLPESIAIKHAGFYRD